MIKIIELKEEWDNLIAKHSPHTFLQSWEWGEAQKLLNQKIWRLGINQEGAAFVYKIIARRGVFLFCPHGPLITYCHSRENGNPLQKERPAIKVDPRFRGDDNGKTRIQQNLEELVGYLIKLGKEEKVDFIRIAPLLENNEANKNLFQKLNFRPAPAHMMHPELAWLLDITPSEEELLSKMEKRTRYSIRKAEKDGVIVKASNDIELFYQMYQETAKRQKFVPFSKNYITKEFDIFVKSNKAQLLVAEYQGEPIASAIIIFDNNSGFYHHGASIRKFKNLPAAELIQWEAIKEAKRRGLKYYNFWGIAPEAAPNHPWAGLTRFKTGFGGFSEKYLHCQDLPLTKKYWLNYTVETVRKILKRY